MLLADHPRRFDAQVMAYQAWKIHEHNEPGDRECSTCGGPWHGRRCPGENVRFE